MGTSKQLLLLGNKTVIRHCVDTLASIAIHDLIVVTGAGNEVFVEALRGTTARVVRNEVPDSQMVDSVLTGLRALHEACSGVLVCLVDHPLVGEDTYGAILEAHRRKPEKIIIPTFKGRRGHPSLFPFSVINEIFDSTTLRDVVRKDDSRIATIDVPDEGVVLDMDTAEDYQKILKRYALKAEA